MDDPHSLAGGLRCFLAVLTKYHGCNELSRMFRLHRNASNGAVLAGLYNYGRGALDKAEFYSRIVQVSP